MGWITGAAIYFVIWWTVIFMVLPWGRAVRWRGRCRQGARPQAPRERLISDAKFWRRRCSPP
ncbi:MAG: DUF1467 family protein [Rhodobacteraceae bacterium]|nr:DUF1467 family protein [Paracoccaceae bacterium]